TAWMLVSASLVLLMTPGLALFYGGMTRSKSVLNMMMMCFGALALIAVIYPLWGWSMSYGASIGGIVGNPLDQLGLSGSFDPVTVVDPVTGAAIPTVVDVGLQTTFAVITVALIAGAIADRVKFSTWLVFAGLWVTLAYFPMAHMVWSGGLLSADGPSAAIAAPAAFAAGPRRLPAPPPPRSSPPPPRATSPARPCPSPAGSRWPAPGPAHPGPEQRAPAP